MNLFKLCATLPVVSREHFNIPVYLIFCLSGTSNYQYNYVTGSHTNTTIKLRNLHNQLPRKDAMTQTPEELLSIGLVIICQSNLLPHNATSRRAGPKPPAPSTPS